MIIGSSEDSNHNKGKALSIIACFPMNSTMTQSITHGHNKLVSIPNTIGNSNAKEKLRAFYKRHRELMNFQTNSFFFLQEGSNVKITLWAKLKAKGNKDEKKT